METLTNSKPIREIIEALPTIKDKIDKTINEMSNYLEYLKDEKFIERPNETEEDAIKRVESIYDRLDETVQRRKFVLKNGKETIELIDEVKLKIENVVESCEKDELHLAKANIELIDIIIDLEERKRIRDIKPLQQQIDDLNKKSIKRKKELDFLKKPHEEIVKKKKEEEVKKRTNNTICFDEMKQIESWTTMKIGNIIFDSNVDNWNVNTSVFGEKVLNKSDLIFLIEDVDNNKFGGYVNAKINQVDRWIEDSKSFVFSLKSNDMKKYNIRQEIQHSFVLYNRTNEYLFLFGNGQDISISKENKKNESLCKQNYFNYNGIENALCGKSNFTPKRITVIQLI